MIEFRALGPAELVGPAGTDTRAVLARPKLLGVLACLSVGASRGFMRRDSLIGIFWSELDEARARSAVRQSLYRLRLFLDEGVVLTRGDDEVAISDAGFWSDVRAFEDALNEGDREAALDVYRGDLLEGFYVPDAPEFERWLDERRKELRRLASTAAWELADQEARLAHTGAAGHWSRHARNLAPLDERLLRRVIKLLDRLGDRSGAVREYETFARRLAKELDLEPAPETRALIDGVRGRTDVLRSDVPTSTPGAAAVAEGSSPEASHKDTRGPSAGDVLADCYRIEKEIGAGGMATVYLAHDLRHERDVAVKVMHPDLIVTQGLERFQREIKIAAGLVHPHIVPVYDSGSADGRLYYVMPYVPGESLRDRLEREGQLPVDEAVRIARDVTEALSHAHSQGVVHRDIKPENILLSGGHALVADFGVARALGIATESRLTRSGMAVGTPPYMSPEQGAGAREVDARSDLYSVGCVLYEMLAGEPPFTGPSAESLARQHLITPPRPITELRPSVPRAVSAALARALAKTPADRFTTASQFIEAMAREVVPDGAPQVRRQPRPALVVSVAGTLALVLAVLVVLIQVGTERAPTLDRNRVAVVPLENRTGDSALALLGSLAADWIAQGLQEIEVIDVVPTATAVSPGPDVAGLAKSSDAGTARAVGRATRAGTLVAGAYYRRGDSLEFQTQVIDAIDERLMRTVTPVTIPTGAPGVALDSLRHRVVTSVAAALDHRLLPSSATSRPPSLDAYRAYIEGHRAFYHAYPLRMRETLEHMYRAVALDSTFPDPRFFLVMAHFNLGEPSAADSNARLLARFRQRLNPYQHALLDWLVAGLRGDRVAALQAARARGTVLDIAVEALRSNRTLETIEILSGIDDLAPFYFHWQALMEALHMVGDHASELTQARRAREAYADRLALRANELRALAALGRLDEVNRGVDEVLFMPPDRDVNAAGVLGEVAAELRAHGFHEASLRVAERAVRWVRSRVSDETATIRSKVNLAMILYQAERWEESRALFQEATSAAPEDVSLNGYLGVLAARRNEREEALRISERLSGKADPYDFGRDVYWQACITAQLGDLDRAVALLQEAYARGRPFGILLHRDMDLEPLHDHPAFREFIRARG